MGFVGGYSKGADMNGRINVGRILLAAIIGGLVVFAWSAVAHMVLPSGHWGQKSMPETSEAAVLSAMKAGLPEEGFYRFPGFKLDATEAEQTAWMEKYKTSPAGILVYKPAGGELVMGKLLGVEFASDVLAGLIAAMIIAGAGGGTGKRMMQGLCLGLFAWINLDVSYWNWDGFPLALILGSLIDQAVGWMLGGAVIGWIVGGGKAAGSGQQ